MGRVEAIPVRDARGDDLTVFEFQNRRFFRKVRYWKLCTGERVRRTYEGRFRIVGTDEELWSVIKLG